VPDDRFLHKRAGHSEKVNLLTDLEYRVWTQYLLSADDFGVMRCSPVTLQADNDHLANRPVKVLARCLEALVKPGGLLQTFDHQNRRYLYQRDWQAWQKVEYPRTTNNPKPPADALSACDDATQKLFVMHPGGGGRKRRESANVPQAFSECSPNDSQTVSECSPPMRAGAPAKRLTANGIRLTANGSEGADAPSMDVWARELVNLYPAQGRCGWNLVERPLFDALTADAAVPAAAAWEALKGRLEQQKRSAQWRAGKISRLDRWLANGLHLQELPEHDPAPEATGGKALPAWVQRAQALKAAQS
jgi:hypothetical protein